VLMLQLEIPIAGATAAARLARQRGVVVILDPAPVPPSGVPDALLENTSILTPNEHEAGELVGRVLDGPGREAEAAEGLRRRGPDTVIVTLGARGACWSTSAGFGRRSPPGVTAIDTVGAGDA